MPYNPFSAVLPPAQPDRFSLPVGPPATLVDNNQQLMAASRAKAAAAGAFDLSSVHNPADLFDALQGLLQGFATSPAETDPIIAARSTTGPSGRTVARPFGWFRPRPSPSETLPLHTVFDPFNLPLGVNRPEGIPADIATPYADPNVRYIPKPIDPQTGFPARDQETATFLRDLTAGKYNDIFNPSELTALSQQLDPRTRPPRPSDAETAPPNERPIPRPSDLFGTSEDRPGYNELEFGTSYATYRKPGLAVLQDIQRSLEAGRITPAQARARAIPVQERGLHELPTTQGAEATRAAFPEDWQLSSSGKPYPNVSPIGSHTLSAEELAARGWNPPADATATGATAAFLKNKGMLATQNTDPAFQRNFRVYTPQPNALKYPDRPLDLAFPETQRRIAALGGFKNMLHLDQPVDPSFGPGLLDIRTASGERALVGQKVDIGTAPARDVAKALNLTPEGLRLKLGLKGIIATAPNGRQFAKFQNLRVLPTPANSPSKPGGSAPAWVKESLQSRGEKSGRIIAPIDIEQHRSLIESDPMYQHALKYFPGLAPAMLTGNITRSELLPILIHMQGLGHLHE
jgi:hypothetical protein